MEETIPQATDQVDEGAAGAVEVPEATLRVKELCKRFRGSRSSDSHGVIAVNGVSFDVQPGDFFTLLGPSGCGKTTTLRCLAGLEHPDSGEIRVGDRILYSSESGGINVRANQRGLGMVFQSYAIWPHMSVLENVRFPLSVKDRKERPSRRQMREAVEQVLSVVQLEGLTNRPATDLSGGQQQRLALARALVTRPPLLLLDEPLSNLDAKLRADMRLELKRLQSELGVTTVYVTHDQTEALAMSDVVAVMRSGNIEQLGDPENVYERPSSMFVAGFIGLSNFVPGVVYDVDRDGQLTIDSSVGRIRGRSYTGHPFAKGDRAVVSIRPEHIQIVSGGRAEAGSHAIEASVRTSAYLGDTVEMLLDAGSQELRVRRNPGAVPTTDGGVTVTLPEDRCAVLPPEDAANDEVGEHGATAASA